MRAPPEARDERAAACRAAIAASQARDELLADGAPHRAAHEREVHDRELERMAVERRARRRRSRRPGRCSARPRRAARRRAAGRRSRAGRRSGRRRPPRRTSRRRRATRSARAPASRKWWPQCAADVERGRELVVAVVRAAARAGVRVLLLRPAAAVDCSTWTSIRVSAHGRPDLRPASGDPVARRGATGLGDELVEHVRRGRVRSGSSRVGAGRAALAEAVDPDVRDAELVRGNDVVEVARGDVDVPRGGRRRARRELAPVPERRLVGADLARRRPSRRTARRAAPSTPRSGRGRSSRGSRAASRGRAPPRAPPAPRERLPAGSDAASPPSSPAGAPSRRIASVITSR